MSGTERSSVRNSLAAFSDSEDVGARRCSRRHVDHENRQGARRAVEVLCTTCW